MIFTIDVVTFKSLSSSTSCHVCHDTAVATQGLLLYLQWHELHQLTMEKRKLMLTVKMLQIAMQAFFNS